uniref:Metallothionein-like protein n=1 Tax=Aegilops tauschii subsp. strangulata TaxID=200361 RepID=A0A453DZD4_AEGTS
PSPPDFSAFDLSHLRAFFLNLFFRFSSIHLVPLPKRRGHACPSTPSAPQAREGDDLFIAPFEMGPCTLCKMYPEMDEGVNTTSQTLIMGVAPSKGTPSFEAAAETGAENGGCKCGPNCTCNPCTCK